MVSGKKYGTGTFFCSRIKYEKFFFSLVEELKVEAQVLSVDSFTGLRDALILSKSPVKNIETTREVPP